MLSCLITSDKVVITTGLISELTEVTAAAWGELMN